MYLPVPPLMQLRVLLLLLRAVCVAGTAAAAVSHCGSTLRVCWLQLTTSDAPTLLVATLLLLPLAMRLYFGFAVCSAGSKYKYFGVFVFEHVGIRRVRILFVFGPVASCKHVCIWSVWSIWGACTFVCVWNILGNKSVTKV